MLYSDSEVYASDSPSPLVKFEMNDHQEDAEDEAHQRMNSSKADQEVKIEIKKPHKFIYPRLNFFGTGGLSSSVADSCGVSVPSNVSASANTVSCNDGSTSSAPAGGCSQQLKLETETNSVNSKKSSPYTFFSMDSEDDFDPYGSDVPSDVDTKRDLLGHGLENQNVDIDCGSCLSASSSTVSTPVCRICQLPGVEPSNPLISPCRCLGSIRYVHNNCLLVRVIRFFFENFSKLFAAESQH